MEQVVQFILVLLKTLYFCIEASIKALLPIGILPRKDVRGQTVLITGSGSGIGRLMAVEFAKLGCVLVLWDINEKGNKETKDLIDSTGVKVCPLTFLNKLISFKCPNTT
ncbi:unnamed protein product [Auanema sp. JU1783]|nr:unnamed protein product [Auanema sp. JU1783]